jgi:hypothetical protein
MKLQHMQPDRLPVHHSKLESRLTLALSAVSYGVSGLDAIDPECTEYLAHLRMVIR